MIPSLSLITIGWQLIDGWGEDSTLWGDETNKGVEVGPCEEEKRAWLTTTRGDDTLFGVGRRNWWDNGFKRNRIRYKYEIQVIRKH